MAQRTPNAGHSAAHGFTLIELLVAVAIMALMAVLGWRALAGMQNTAQHTRAHTDAVLTLEAALAQWGTDLDAMVELPYTSTIDWDGRALRITRNDGVDPALGVRVVAWSRSQRAGTDQWLRWQSAPVHSRQAWQDAWHSAAEWAQSTSQATRPQEVALTALTQWQIYYFRGGAWSNPLSSSGTSTGERGAGAATSAPTPTPVPDGVRLVLTLPPDAPLAGTLTRDWARPTGGPSTP